MPFVANLSTPVPVNLSVAVLQQYSAVQYLVPWKYPLADGLQMATSLSDGAQATSDAFTSLNNSINAFTATFADFAFEQNQHDNDTIILLSAQISSLQGEIAVYVWINVFCFKD
jgi:hypothetical protein